MADQPDNERLLDDLLLQRARAGDPDAFDDLFTRHKDGVYACLWHLLDSDAELVEEAVGSVFLNAYRGMRGFRGAAEFSTWLYRIAVNEALARRRKKRQWLFFRSVPLKDEMLERADRVGEDPTEEVLRAAETEMLWKAVHALPEPYRTPIVLRYSSGMDSREIAEVLKRPAGTVRYQLSRALSLLRERLGNDLGTK